MDDVIASPPGASHDSAGAALQGCGEDVHASVSGDLFRLIAVVGPSGAGKDSLLQAWRDRLGSAAPVHFAQRTITRPPDPHGEGHESIDDSAFEWLLASGGLAFHWRAHDLSYGIRRDQLAPLAEGRWVVFNASRAHLQGLAGGAGDIKVVEVRAPDALLRQRLAQRGRESGDALAARLDRRVPALRASLVLQNDGRPIADLVEALHRRWSEWALPP